MNEPDIAALLNKVEVHFNQNLPFVVYSKPNAKKVIGVFQNDDTLHQVENFTDKGFAFVSFDSNEMILIPYYQSQILMADFAVFSSDDKSSTFDETDSDEAKSNYINLVQKGIDAIQTGDFGKVVLSRKESFSVPKFELISAFQKLLQSYPTAFSYCFFHPKVGLWLGAFSEQLIRVKNKNLHTMAVAGTQVYQENETAVWESKEKAEQQFVTDFITESLHDYVKETKISEPYTMKAGNLIHLKTDIEAALNEPSNLKEVIKILHPTPAVCGFPKENAKVFIMNNEGYDREFYSGFLGELNHDFEKNENSIDLYVNLRCMKVENETVNLFVGCGITKDSIPENEWTETVNKSKTIKKILY
ncbi:isochorismate synthase [Flavobacterium sp.]|uniref:isochorismate synthase n=1 Tax=Flavobacterium sp. TaxID=239 RepID=UPI00286B3E4B|nr:isochorismate synthase [Flavobacterium sp.]